MRIPRSRGVISGILLVILGAWVAIIPFVGPTFKYAIGSTTAWDWTAGRFWLNVLPGAVAIPAAVFDIEIQAVARGECGKQVLQYAH